MNTSLVEIRGLEKEFSGTRVLKGVDLDFLKGEVDRLRAKYQPEKKK